MKYWSALSNLESEIIRLDSMNSLLNVVAEGIENSSSNDVRNVIWYIQGSIQDINEKISDQFSELFDTIRSDTKEVDESQTEEFDEEEIEYNFEPLTEVVNSWIKQ